MPFPLVGAPGDLFNALGSMGAVISNCLSAQLTSKNTVVNSPTGLLSQLSQQQDIEAVAATSWTGWLAAIEAAASSMPNLAQLYINRLVFLAQPQLGQSLSSVNLTASINYVFLQMLAQNATILQMTVGATTTAFTGTGNGTINISLKRPFDGKLLENAFAEVLTYTCIADSYIGGAAAFNEQFAVTGEASEPDFFAYDWPLGSNGNISINAIDGDTNEGSGNLLNNSGFTTWTGSVPNNWTVNAGASTISQNSSIIFTAGSSMLWTGDGSTLTSIQQQFNISTGNTSTLSPQTQYSVNLYLRTGGTPPSQGVLQVDLVDQNGTIINDQAGTPNSYTIDLTTLSTAWTGFPGSFRMQEPIPPTQKQFLRYHLTTALNNGALLYIDKTSFGLQQQIYSQGPFTAVHSGSTPFVQSPLADYAYCQVTNSRGAGGTLDTFQTLLYRLYSQSIGFELIWPSSLSPTISDGLI